MPVTIKADIVLFDKDLALELKTREANAKVQEVKHNYAIYDTSVKWDKDHKTTLQWVRDKFEDANQKKQTRNSFTLLPGYELKITSIPGLNIQLEKPVSIQFNRLSVGKEGGRYFPEPKKGEVAGETDEEKAKRKQNEKEGIAFEKFDFEIIANVWGKKITLSPGAWSQLNALRPQGGGTPATTPKPEGVTQSEDGTVWWNVNKESAGLSITSLGFEYKDGKICVLMDASVTLAGLRFGVMGLSAKTKPATMFSELPEFDFQGLEFGYYSEAVSLGAALLKEQGTLEDGTKYTQFIGAALLKLSKFDLCIYGVGAYAKVKGTDSLFLYFGLNKTLGGPPFFLVTGLAIGFGFNRRLELSFENMEKFPLIGLAFGDPLPTGGLLGLAKNLSPYIPPSLGSIFIMAGIRFDTFKLIKSFALFVVYLTGRFKLDLYIISRLDITKGGTKYVFIELKIRGSLNPSEGYVKVDGAVTNNSFILNKDIKLTGGFAFYAWWAGEHEGDFVLTVGGYHPKFNKPDHYPDVPRLRLEWKISDKMRVFGELYFALTPRAVMAGIHVGAVYKSGILTVTFKAGMDFLIQWEPFHYDINVYVQLAIRVHIEISFGILGSINAYFSLKAGASLHIYGPEFALRGKAYLEIDVGIATVKITASISIGGKPADPPPLEWNAFETKMLPEKTERLSLDITDGVVDKHDDILILDKQNIKLKLESKIPANTILYNEKDNNAEKEFTGQDFKIGLMETSTIKSSKLKVDVRDSSGKHVDEGLFIPELINKNVPGSLWGEKTKDLNAAATVPAASGVKLHLGKAPIPGKTEPLPISQLDKSLGPVSDIINFEDEAFSKAELEAWLGETVTLDNSFYKEVQAAQLDLV